MTLFLDETSLSQTQNEKGFLLLLLFCQLSIALSVLDTKGEKWAMCFFSLMAPASSEPLWNEEDLVWWRPSVCLCSTSSLTDTTDWTGHCLGWKGECEPLNTPLVSLVMKQGNQTLNGRFQLKCDLSHSGHTSSGMQILALPFCRYRMAQPLPFLQQWSPPPSAGN